MVDPDALRAAATAARERGHVLTGDLLDAAAGDIERLKALIKSASELAGSGMRDEAAELLHAEVYPDQSSTEASE